MNIGLSGSDHGIDYLLYQGTTILDTIAGTGTLLNFGLHATPGGYTVVGMDTTVKCRHNMTGMAMVITDASVLPSVSVSASPATACLGTPCTVSPVAVNGGSAPAYLWQVNGTYYSSGGVLAYYTCFRDTVTVKLISNAYCVSPIQLTAHHCQ